MTQTSEPQRDLSAPPRDPDPHHSSSDRSPVSALRSVVASARDGDKRRVILGIAALMVAAQIGFRAWALYPSWFYTDDYTLMNQAKAHSWPDPGYLAEQFNSHFIPFGRLVIWLVAQSGTTNWALAASITLALQLVTSAACLWMLQTLFGVRWANLALFALYLTNAMAMPALMWWTACLTQLPVQLAFFLAVGSWVRYLRHRRFRWALLAALALLLGLSSDVRTMLVAPLLIYVMVAYFGSGTPRQRLTGVVRAYWPALLVGGLVTIGYTVYYVLVVPPPFDNSTAQTSGLRRALEVADSMLGNALTSGSVGGPWNWFKTTPPIVLAAPPNWSVHLAWVAIALTLSLSLLRRSRVLRGWLLMLAYAVGLYVLLVVSRGQVYGRLAGMEYRYLTDMVCVIPLCLGLIFLPLLGAPQSSQEQRKPLLRRGLGTAGCSAAVALVCIGSMITSVEYVGYWHNDNASRSYVKTLQTAMASAGGRVDLPNQLVPPEVMPSYTSPNDITQNYVPLVAANARFPDSTDDLQVITSSGELRPADIRLGYKSVPGAANDCGHRITATGATVPLTQSTVDFTWWMRIGYISSTDSPVTVTAGRSAVKTRLRKGLHSLFVKADGVFGSVQFSGLGGGTTVCVDVIEVGYAVQGEGP